MAYKNVLSETAEEAVQQKFLEAAKESRTIGEVRENVRKNIDGIAYPHGAAVDAVSAAKHQEYAGVMKKKQQEFEKATKGYEQVQLEDFGGGKGGENLVGGSKSTAKVSRDIVSDTEKLNEVLIHESHEEVGHSSQALPEVSNQETVLVYKNNKSSATKALEGDVERGTQKVLGKGAKSHREDQPEKDYGEGQRMANEIIDEVGEDEWNAVLKKNGKNAGDFGKLQGKIWEKQLKQNKDAPTVDRVMKEAEETGYHEEAMEAVANAHS